MSRTLKVTGNHVIHITSVNGLLALYHCALCCLPSVKKEKHDFFNFFPSMYNKTIIRFGFCDIQNNQGLGKGYEPHSSNLIILIIIH